MIAQRSLYGHQAVRWFFVFLVAVDWRGRLGGPVDDKQND